MTLLLLLGGGGPQAEAAAISGIGADNLALVSAVVRQAGFRTPRLFVTRTAGRAAGIGEADRYQLITKTDRRSTK